MPLTVDKNGLLFSNHSDSGYRFVTTFFDGPLVGKFIAFADVNGDRLQRMNLIHANRVTGFFGFKNVVALGIYSDVRDAAHVGQQFYGSGADERDSNLEALFAGNESVIVKPPSGWLHDPDYNQLESAKNRSIKRAASRAKINVQKTMYDFNKAHGAEYNVYPSDAAAIRDAMKSYLASLAKPKQIDAVEAARLAFEPYLKAA